MAAERTGYSKLKEGITADELLSTNNESAPKIVAPEDMDDQDGEGDDEEEEDDEEDDFLARELGEEWG